MTPSCTDYHGTTIIAIKKDNGIVVAGDGQVTLNHTVVKHSARKVRRLYKDKIVVGFAGATADAFNLFDRFEAKLERFNGNLTRSAVELAKDWRTDKYLRRLEAVMIAVDHLNLYLISGNGDVIEPDEGVIGIGSGGVPAQAAATALMRNSSLSAREIAKESMNIAASICIYTNNNITIEEIQVQE
jgi:ATP-dependent HslUV protease subunit HslV